MLFTSINASLKGAKKKFPIVIVEGSGRASDAMASYIRHMNDKIYLSYCK